MIDGDGYDNANFRVFYKNNFLFLYLLFKL